MRGLGDDDVVAIDEMLDLGDLNYRVEVGGYVGDLDDLGVDGGAAGAGGETLQAMVVVGKEGAKAGDVPRAVLVDAYLGGVEVGFDEGLEEELLEVEGFAETLIVGADGGLQANKVELEALALDDAPDEVGEAGLGTAGEEDAEGVFLLHTKPDELDDLLVPPAVPGAGLLALDAVAGGG